MVAAAYKVTLVAALGSPNGPRKQIAMTASDVNAAFWLYPSGASELALNGNTDVYIVDTILSASGTDTSNCSFFIGGQNTGVVLLNATSLATTIGRPFQNAPLRLPAGLALKVVQNT